MKMDWEKSIAVELETGEREEPEETEQDDYSNSDIEDEHNQ